MFTYLYSGNLNTSIVIKMSFKRFTVLKSFSKFENLNFLRQYSSKTTINLSDPAIQTYLKHLMLEHENLQTKIRKNIEDTKRLHEIKPIVNVLEQRITLFDSIQSLKELNNRERQDEEIKKMIKEEAEIYLKRLKEADDDLQSILIEPYLSQGGIMIEVTAGAGGQESMLFAKELFDMYKEYANYKDWEVDVASIEKSDLGGIRKGSLIIQGIGAPELMKIEAGVHRVQRIPVTEKGGRIHTSTVSVAVLPLASEIELEIADRDLSIETKRASGAGGQHVNTTDSAVRITHIPTGTVVECQEGRSQIKNKQIALQKLRTILLEKQETEQTSKINTERKSQIGSSNRNEKIRTYNYPQDRVTEHREGGGTTRSLKTFMQGSEQLEELQESLLRQKRYQFLMADIENFIARNKIETSGKS